MCLFLGVFIVAYGVGGDMGEKWGLNFYITELFGVVNAGDVIGSIMDPSLKWNSYRVRGGFARWGTITTSNPQLLHICDEYICLPVRFSEYFYWSDGSGNLVSRIFPNNDEAWDHTNETNPNTSAPYDGTGQFIHGLGGYGGYLDLVCGTSKCTVTLVVRRYPEPQILIYNLSSGTIRVNDPPREHGFSSYTNGTPGADYVDLGPNKYVVYYKTVNPAVDSSGFFSQSPLGVSKRWSYEFYIPNGATLSDKTFPTIYTGIKAHKDIPVPQSLFAIIDGSVGNRGGINVGGVRGWGIGGFNVYKDDPYCSQGTWAESNIASIVFNGWAEDDSGNVKYIFESGLDISTNTKMEEKYRRYAVKLYVVDNDEWIVSAFIKPTVNTTSYSRNALTIAPDFGRPDVFAASYNKSMYMSPTDAVTEVTSAITACWDFRDGWALANFVSSPISGAVAEAALFIYTDDAGVSLPSDARSAFGVGYCNSVIAVGLQVVPFGDRVLSAGKIYAVAVRYKIFSGSVTSTDIANWAKRIYPKVLSSSEWSSLLSTVPFRVALMGANIIPATVSVTVPSSTNPGKQITVSGNVGQQGNVYVVMYDPNTYRVVASASATSDASGNFSASLTVPSNISVGTYKVMVISEK